MNLLINFLVIDIPEAFILLLVGMSVFNISIRENLKKTVIFSLLYAIPSFLLTYFGVYAAYKIFSLYAIMNVLIYILLRTNIGLTIGISTSSYILLNIVQMALILVINTLSINLEVIGQNPLFYYSLAWLYLSVLLALSYLFRKHEFDLRKFFPNSPHNKYLFLLVVVGSIEMVVIITMNTNYIIEKLNPSLTLSFISSRLPFYHFVVMVLFIILVYLFRIYLKITINRVETETQTPYLKNIDDLLTAIRSIKHDAINHFTAVDGLLKVKSYDLASDYVKQLLDHATNVITVVEGVNNPAVSALFHSKMAICLANHISLEFNITSQAQFHQVKTNDLITILGNLLDNAIRAVEQEPEENRFIKIEWKDEFKVQSLTIENTGPSIPTDKLVHVFDLGYTTKKSGEGGVGLAVVKNVIDKYNGKVVLYSKDGITRFTIKFPL